MSQRGRRRGNNHSGLPVGDASLTFGWRASVMGGWLLALAAMFGIVTTGCETSRPTAGSAWERRREAVRGYSAGAAQAHRGSDESAPIDLALGGALSREAARAHAVRANPDVHAASARLETARARVAEAQSRYSPTVTFTHNSARTFQTPASRNRLASGLAPAQTLPSDIDTNTLAITTLLNALRRPLFAGSVGGDGNSFSEHSSSLTASWNVFDGFVREAQVLGAKHLVQAAALSRRDVERLILRAVDAAYFQVQLAEEQIRIAEADQRFSEEQADEAEKLRRAGRASVSDVDNFRVRVLAARTGVAEAIGLRDVGLITLAELMGVDGARFSTSVRLDPLAEETERELSPPDEASAVARALTHRPDIAQLDELTASESENVRATKGAYLPTVNVSSSYGFDHSGNIEYSVEDQSSAAAVELRWDLYTGGARDARLRAAESARVEAAARLNRQRLAVQSEVRRAVVDVTIAQQQIVLQRQNVMTALENRRLIQAGYSAGKETLNRLNESQRDYIAADVGLVTARIRLRQAFSDLDAATAWAATPESEHPAE